jgi:CheY-like chemotaxis protein
MEIQPHKKEYMVPIKRYVLLGEDDEDDVAFFKEAFTSRYPHVDILHYDNGRELFNFLVACPSECLPDFLLLDNLMPMMPAMDILKALEKQPRFEKMVKAVWSTLILPPDQARCIALGCSYYFDKPVSKKEWQALAGTIGFHFELEATGS